MSTFDRVLLALGGAAQAVAMATVAGGAPTWVVLLCQAVAGAAGVSSRSVRELLPAKEPPK